MPWLEDIGAMLRDHWFWGGLTIIVLLWYSTVTVYVTVKGTGDIRSMLGRLAKRKDPIDTGP